MWIIVSTLSSDTSLDNRSKAPLQPNDFIIAVGPAGALSMTLSLAFNEKGAVFKITPWEILFMSTESQISRAQQHEHLRVQETLILPTCSYFLFCWVCKNLVFLGRKVSHILVYCNMCVCNRSAYIKAATCSPLRTHAVLKRVVTSIYGYKLV